MATQEWQLPNVNTPTLGVSLNAGEIKYLDWAICGASRILPDTDLDYLIGSWHPFRLDLWRLLVGINDSNETGLLELSDEDAKVLLAVLSPTFRWGTGPDVGYSLKMKVARFLLKLPDPQVEAEQPAEAKAPEVSPSVSDYVPGCNTPADE